MPEGCQSVESVGRVLICRLGIGSHLGVGPRPKGGGVEALGSQSGITDSAGFAAHAMFDVCHELLVDMTFQMAL